MEFKDPEKHAAHIAWLIEESMKAEPTSAIAGLGGIELDFRERLNRVDVPALLLYGEFSKMTTPANREFMKTRILDAKLVVFHQSAHNPMLEEPEKFNREVRDFANSV